MGKNIEEENKIKNLSNMLGIPIMEVARAMLRKGVEYVEPGLVFPTTTVKAKSCSEKAAANFLFAKELIKQNREPGKINSLRNIFQEGGPLKPGEWIGTTELPDGKGLFFWGTRGVGTINKRRE